LWCSVILQIKDRLKITILVELVNFFI